MTRSLYARALAFARGVLGADKYRQYLAYHRSHEPGREPMTEKEYWRSYYAHQEDHPGSRCC